jgi:hypothetical protein
MIPGDTVLVQGNADIKIFKVNEFSPDTALFATISNDSIIVYWPSYKTVPAMIKPEISLSGKATISPASGEEVPFVNGTVYTVTSEAGTQNRYKLYIDFRQPKPTFTFNGNSLDKGRITGLGGDWFLADTARTKVFLVTGDAQQEYATEIVSVSANLVNFIVPITLPDDKLYDIKIVNGIHTIYNNNENVRGQVHLNDYPDLSELYTIGSPFNLKHGDVFEVRGLHLLNTKAASLFTYPDFVEIPIEVVEIIAHDRVKLKITDNVPAGNYRDMILYMSDDGLSGSYAYNSVFSITVSE